MSTLQCNFPRVRNFFREIFLRRRFSQKYSQKFKKSEEFTNPLSFSISSTITNILALNFARIFNLIRLFFIENQLGQLFKVIKAYRISWIFHCCNVTRCLRSTTFAVTCRFHGKTRKKRGMQLRRPHTACVRGGMTRGRPQKPTTYSCVRYYAREP